MNFIGTILSAFINRSSARELENIAQRNRLRLAAIDRRLEAHQQAFALLWKLVDQRASEISSDHTRKCESWWADNCLYLTEEARNAFRAVCNNLPLNVSYNSEGELVLPGETWARITTALMEIVEGVGLPGLGEEERTRVSESTAAQPD